MPCDSPITIYPKYIKGDTGLNFYEQQMSQQNYTYPAPCGKCPPCKKSRVEGWTFRLLQEEKSSYSAHFVTLTYNTDHVPISDNGFVTLNRRDLTLFFKQLRTIQNRDKDTPENHPAIKYYACGEYGSLNQRPHYHLILFNTFNVINIGKAWKQGNIHIGKSVTGASIAYTAQYVDKQKSIPQFYRDDRIREFSVMSKFLGKSYYENQEILDYHNADPINRNFVSLGGGKKQGMPKYYREKIFSRKNRLLQNKKIVVLAKELEQKHHDKVKNENQSYFNYEKSLKMGRYYKFYKNVKIRN